MESIRNCAAPPEFGQAWLRENYLGGAEFSHRNGGSPHSPNDGRTQMLSGYSAPGAAPIGGVTAAAVRHSAGDYRVNPEDEFKKHLASIFMQRDVMHLHQMEQMHVKMEAVSIELIKTKSVVLEERRMREEMMSVMVAKEKREEERVREETEEAKRMGEIVWSQGEENKRLREMVEHLAEGQATLREIIERKFDEEEQRRKRVEEERLTREILEREKREADEEEKEKARIEKESEMIEKELMEKEEKAVDTPSTGGAQTPASGGRTNSSSVRGSGGSVTCYSCHQEGHYARDCGIDLKDIECELCGGMGHAATACFPSKRCYNCNKTGHRHFECTEQGSRRCFHCRKVGHLAMNCKNAPK